jgi:hypothetical protein
LATLLCFSCFPWPGCPRNERNMPVQVPNGAYGHFLLGRIARLTSRPEVAAAHFEKCLILNPMMWSAYEELCSLGALQCPDSSCCKCL